MATTMARTITTQPADLIARYARPGDPTFDGITDSDRRMGLLIGVAAHNAMMAVAARIQADDYLGALVAVTDADTLTYMRRDYGGGENIVVAWGRANTIAGYRAQIIDALYTQHARAMYGH